MKLIYLGNVPTFFVFGTDETYGMELFAIQDKIRHEMKIIKYLMMYILKCLKMAIAIGDIEKHYKEKFMSYFIKYLGFFV